MRVVLLPGAGGAAMYWSRVVPLIEAHGHEAVAVELPADDESAGLAQYLDVALGACDGAQELLVVAQSMGGFTGLMLADRLQREGRTVRGLVFLNAMVPALGETPGEWWTAVGAEPARVAAAVAGGWSQDFDMETYFLHDQDEATVTLLMQGGKDEVHAAFGSPCEVEAYPEVPIRVLVGSEDRFFPPAFQKQVAQERLGLDVTLVPGGHLAALSFPAEIAEAVVVG